jgi:hypothetical protein
MSSTTYTTNTTRSTPPSCLQVQNKMNVSIYKRNIPSRDLQPNINARPVSTKYAFYPIVDQRRRGKYPLKQYPSYETSFVFNPSDDLAPSSGFRKNINVESELRNQIYALQKGDRAVYVPTSSSDLYKPMWVPQNQIQNPRVFHQEKFNSFNPDVLNINQFVYNNSTRTQLKNVKS